MDQSFLWKAPAPDDTYAAPAHDPLLRDRFDSTQLRLQPALKHGLSSEGPQDPSHQAGLAKRMDALGPLSDIPAPLPIPAIITQNMSPGHAAEGAHGSGTGVPDPGNTPAAASIVHPADGVAPRNTVHATGKSASEGSAAAGPEGGRKVVSTKRAAQNRNSQTAYRKRRQKYVQELESTAEKVKDLEKTIEELRSENMELREFSLALQTRVMELERDAARH